MIDVLLPFYGDPDLMKLAVRSVLDQTASNWRLIVVDDGYPDPTIRSWFDELDHSRVSYHRNPTNLGANGNYRRSLELAEASHVVVMGADDVMHPDYLARMDLLAAAFPDAGALTCRVRVIDEVGVPVQSLIDLVKLRMTPSSPQGPAVVAGESAIARVLQGTWTYFPAICWRRDLVTRIGFRRFNVVQDLALLVDVLRTGAPLIVDDAIAFDYRRHRASDSSRKSGAGGARFDEEAAYFREIARELEADGCERAARAARLHLTSRVHAATTLPAALSGRDRGGLRAIARHALSNC
jgi:glycosyltransferase involved in cell wall biosynthesis